jgi:hypothetical protein
VCSVEKLIEQVRRLSPEEQRRLRHLLDEEFAAVEAAGEGTEEAFQHQLVRLGLLHQLKRPQRNAEAFQRREPVPILGKPLSETIIEERR